jgi:hypothetical protein
MRYQLTAITFCCWLPSPISYHSALNQFTNPEFRTVNSNVLNSRLLIGIRRDIVGGLHEDIDMTNHHSEAVKFQLMLDSAPNSNNSPTRPTMVRPTPRFSELSPCLKPISGVFKIRRSNRNAAVLVCG